MHYRMGKGKGLIVIYFYIVNYYFGLGSSQS